MRERYQQRGFTLVELMLVVIIIGVLAAMIVPRLAGRSEQAKVARAKADIGAISLAMDLYEFDVGSYPQNIEVLVQRDAPAGFEGTWNGPYLKKGVPKDPWGQTYKLTVPSQHGQDYDISSLGSDRQVGKDDVTSWE